MVGGYFYITMRLCQNCSDPLKTSPGIVRFAYYCLSKGWRPGSPFVSRAIGIEIEVPVNRALHGADALDVNIQVLFEHDLVLRREVGRGNEGGVKEDGKYWTKLKCGCATLALSKRALRAEEVDGGCQNPLHILHNTKYNIRIIMSTTKYKMRSGFSSEDPLFQVKSRDINTVPEIIPQGINYKAGFTC